MNQAAETLSHLEITEIDIKLPDDDAPVLKLAIVDRINVHRAQFDFNAAKILNRWGNKMDNTSLYCVCESYSPSQAIT